MQMGVPKGRANYEPNSTELHGEAAQGPRESLARGLHTTPVTVQGAKVRLRAESFADHYSQARLFYRSVTPQEQDHIGMALTFELGKVETLMIRRRMLGHLKLIDEGLEQYVSDRLGMAGEAETITPPRTAIDLPVSPALRLYGRYPDTLMGRKVGVLLGTGFDPKIQKALVAGIEKAGAVAFLIAPKVGGVADASGAKHSPHAALNTSPSVLFDAVAILAGAAGDKELSSDPDAVGFAMDACRHLKAIGLAGAPGLASKAGAAKVAGVTELGGAKDIAAFLKLASAGKVWARVLAK
jgi:catalase